MEIRLGNASIFKINDSSGTELMSSNIMSSLAPAYDNTNTYAIGDLCTYAGKLYVCTTAITTAEDWDSTHWCEENIAKQISNIKAFDGEINITQSSNVYTCPVVAPGVYRTTGAIADRIIYVRNVGGPTLTYYSNEAGDSYFAGSGSNTAASITLTKYYIRQLEVQTCQDVTAFTFYSGFTPDVIICGTKAYYLNKYNPNITSGNIDYIYYDNANGAIEQVEYSLNSSTFDYEYASSSTKSLGTKLYRHRITPINVSYGGVQYQLTGSVINTNANAVSDLSELFDNTVVVSQSITFRNSSYVYFRCNGYSIADGSFIGVDDNNQVHSFYLNGEWLYEGISITDTVTPL